MFLEATGIDGVLVNGDSVGFNIRPDIDSYLLLINIDPAGSINVIYPLSRREMGKVSARTGLSLHDIGQVGPPFGIETIKVFAFRDRPSGFSQLMGSSFSPTDRRFSSLMESVDRQGAGLSQMTIQLKTAARSDIVRSVR